MNFADKLYASLKSVAKVCVQSRVLHGRGKCSGRIVVMGNGPSLSASMPQCLELMRTSAGMSVNFAAVAPEFKALRPEYYVLADPHFFKDIDDGNLATLRRNIKAVDWKMELFVPAPMQKKAMMLYGSENVEIRAFNAVGVEGFQWLEHTFYKWGLGMPRPRNVLIPAIMIALGEGFREVLVFGADHSWMSTLSVTDRNEVVSVQPHFYKDGEEEEARVRHEYRGYRLDQIVESFAIAFRAYHRIEAFARKCGARVVNATPGSFIDAFERL